MSFTSNGDAHTQRSHLGLGSGVVHRAAPPDKGHRSGAEGAEAAHHRDPRMDGGEAHSLPSGDVGGCGVRSRRGHSSLGAWGQASVHDSVPGGCIHGAWGTFGRIHPWVGRAGVGSETGTGHGRDDLHGSESGENDEMGRWFLGSKLRGLDYVRTGGWVPYIRNAGHTRTFELVSVQLFHSSLEVVGGFEFNKPCVPCQCMAKRNREREREREPGPGLRLVDAEPTLCLVHGRSRNRPHPVLTGGQSLSGPKKGVVSPGPGK